MSRVFDSYAEEHAELCAAAGRAIAMLRGQAPGPSRKETQATAENELRKAEEMVQQMELEARSAPKGDAGRALQARVKACRSEVGVLRSSLKQAAASVPRADAILGGSSGDEGADDQRAQLLRMGERMQEGTSKLQQAHRVIVETEAIGGSILRDLRDQRETITHAAGTLQRANEGLLRSKRTLAAISRRALGNKLLMWCMIALLALGCFVLLWGCERWLVESASCLVLAGRHPPVPVPSAAALRALSHVLSTLIGIAGSFSVSEAAGVVRTWGVRTRRKPVKH